MATNPDALFADLIPGRSSATGAPVYGAPAKPDKPETTWRTLGQEEAKGMGLTPSKVWQVSSNGETKAVGDAPPQVDQQDALKQAISGLGLGEMLDNIQRARANLQSPWASGTLGAVATMKPGGGTPRDNFLGNLTAVKGGVITEKLQSLKEASKTGASGFGALSEKEGALLASSLAALTENMSPDEYEKSFKAIAQHAYTLQAVRDGIDPNSTEGQAHIKANVNAMFAAQKAEDKSAAAPAPDNGGGGGGETLGASSLTPDQTAAYSAFWKSTPNPTPDQLKTFLGGIGINNVQNAEEIIKAAKAGKGFSTTQIKTDYADKVAQRVRQDDSLGLGESPVTALAMQGGTLNLSDEAAGVGNAAANVLTAPFTGNFDPVGSYQFGRDAERLRIDNARQQLGYGGTAIEIGGALASGNPSSALASITPQIAARGGAVGAALAGFGAGEGAAQSAEGGVGGALAGYAVGRYAQPVLEGIVNRVVPTRFRAPQGMAPELAAAAQAEGVDLNRAMVDPRARPEFGALESDRYAQPVIRDAVESTRAQMADATERLGGAGTPMEPGAAGGVVQAAGRRFIQRSRNVADRLYSRARSIAGDTRFEPTQAIAQVDSEIEQLAANPTTNAGEISFLQGLRSDLTTPGGKTVEELRQLRTSLRGRVSEQNLTATQAEARAIRALDATQQDVAAAIPEAASSYRRADTYYRERMTHIDDIIERVTGGRVGTTDHVLSGEQALARIRSMASPGGDGRRLAALMRDLSPNERQDIAATFAQQLGRDAADEPFSAAKFLIQTRKLSPSARRTIFGPDGAQSIQNLRVLSQALKDAGQDINRSRSATTLERAGWRRLASGFITSLTGLGGAGLGTAVGGAAGGVTGAIAGATVATGAMAASAARRTLSARAMVNPRVSRWLAESAGVSSRAQAQAQLRRLGTIISREPALANELQPVYAALNDNLATPLAAQPAAEGNQNDE